jgi:aspartate 1-decarboxylase
MLRTYVLAKLHGIAVTAANVDYHGSVTIGQVLMAGAAIEPYEQVHVVNLNSGQRWVTYAIPGEGPVFELNGGGARLGVVGDRCVVMAYGQAESFPGARVLELDDHNMVIRANGYRQ